VPCRMCCLMTCCNHTLITAAISAMSVCCRLLEAVREQGALQDVLPEEVQQKYGLGNWLEDLEEVHRPTTEANYQRACKGVAMRVRRIRSCMRSVACDVMQRHT
jgi:RecG-like helicase